MISEKQRAQAQHDPVDVTGSNGTSRAAPTPTRGELFARRAKSLLATLPTNLDVQLKEHPYRTLGVVCAVGLGAGVVLSSRILRTVLANAVSVAIVQIGRAYLLREFEPSR